MEITQPAENPSGEGNIPDQPAEPAGGEEQAGDFAGLSYYIEIGDVFEVKIYNSPELAEVLVVRPDGKISLLLAEEIQAAGLTPAELDCVITDLYSKQLSAPQVTIIMRKFAGNRIYVGGEVNQPTELLIEGRLTLLQAIYKAGGFKQSAKHTSVVLLRDQGTDIPSVRLVDVKSILDGGEGNVLLYPYDAIFVPKTFIAKADQFVDQYINKIVPSSLSAGISWTYNLTPWLEVFNR